MTFRLDSQLPAALRDQGVTVVELGVTAGAGGSDWRTWQSAFAAKPVGQANHWDAIGKGIDPARWSTMLQRFQPFGGAATYNGGVYDNGAVYLWASGRTVNVGKVDSRKLARVKAGQDIGTDQAFSGDTYGNAVLLGWVLRNSGVKADDPITDEQRRSLVLLNATVCELYGLDPVTSIHHWELTSRKIDIALKRLGLDIRATITNHLETSGRGPVFENGDNMSIQEQWQMEEAAISRMEQLYREYRGPDSVPGKEGYQFWVGQIRANSHLGAAKLAEIVLAGVENGLKKETGR